MFPEVRDRVAVEKNVESSGIAYAHSRSVRQIEILAVALLKNTGQHPGSGGVPGGDPSKLRSLQRYVLRRRCRGWCGCLRRSLELLCLRKRRGRRRWILQGLSAGAGIDVTAELVAATRCTEGPEKRFCQAHPTMMTAPATNSAAPPAKRQSSFWVHPSSTVVSRPGGILRAVCAGEDHAWTWGLIGDFTEAWVGPAFCSSGFTGAGAGSGSANGLRDRRVDDYRLSGGSGLVAGCRGFGDRSTTGAGRLRQRRAPRLLPVGAWSARRNLPPH